ncbi:hypothetical protein P7K49_008978, partial [Saguinus oedipus]
PVLRTGGRGRCSLNGPLAARSSSGACLQGRVHCNFSACTEPRAGSLRSAEGHSTPGPGGLRPQEAEGSPRGPFAACTVARADPGIWEETCTRRPDGARW